MQCRSDDSGLRVAPICHHEATRFEQRPRFSAGRRASHLMVRELGQVVALRLEESLVQAVATSFRNWAGEIAHSRILKIRSVAGKDQVY